MTAQEKERITRLRGEGKSYGAIAALLGISASKVKSYCIRHELGGARSSVGRHTANPAMRLSWTTTPTSSGTMTAGSS